MTTRREFVAAVAGAGAAAPGARVKRPSVSLEEARAVHRRALVIDAHNDIPVERVHRGEKPLQWRRRDPAYQTDIPRMKEGGYDAGFFIVGDGPTANVWVTTERVLQEIESDPKDLQLVLGPDDLLRAKKAGKTGVILAIEGAARWLDAKIEVLQILYRLGIRSAGVTHGEGGNQPGMLQGDKSHYGRATPDQREAERKSAAGLTAFGNEFVKTCNQLGVVVDLAHINDRAFYEVLERSSRPPIMSHTAVFALGPHWRCMTDDQIKALAAAGGVMGIAFAPEFIHPDPKMATPDRIVEHICHVADLVGIDHVGIGTDFDGLGSIVPVIPDVAQLPTLTRSMLAYGLSEEEIAKVWGGNFLRVLRKTIDRG